MKTITPIPAPIRGATFQQAVTYFLDNDNRFAESAGMRAAVRIDAALRASNTSGQAVLEDDDWVLLKAVIANIGPECLARSDSDSAIRVIAVGLIAARVLGPFATAVNNAT